MGFLSALIDAITGRTRKPVAKEPEVKPPTATPVEEVVKPPTAAPAEEVVKPPTAAPAEAVVKPKVETAHDDFSTIRGIGLATQARLNEAGITTYAKLAQATPEQLEEITGRSASRIAADGWTSQARKLAGKG